MSQNFKERKENIIKNERNEHFWRRNGIVLFIEENVNG